MKRDPVEQFLRKTENKAKLFKFITYGMIITTFLIVIGTLILILHLVGIF